MPEHSSPDPLALLTEGVAALSLELAPNVLEQLQIYLAELKLWNAKTNLTGLKTDRDIVIKHFLDSLAVLPFLDGAASVVDLGSGGGFPGLVLKLARPQLALTLVEARDRKAAFLEYLVARFKLTGVQVAQTHLTPYLAETWQPKAAAVVSRAAFILPPPLGTGGAASGPGRRGAGPQGGASGLRRTGGGRVGGAAAGSGAPGTTSLRSPHQRRAPPPGPGPKNLRLPFTKRIRLLSCTWLFTLK